MCAKVSGDSNRSLEYIQMVIKNQSREEELRRKYGYRDQDHVSIYTLPKGQRGKKYGSFSYKPMSMRAKRLQETVYTIKGKILKMESADLPPKEKAKKLGQLRCQLKYMTCKLSTEVEAMPKVGVIVLEEDE
ncbi:MAG: hypothetical protein LBV27_02330 [Oscillospiraceae bacterium]|jgi:hypothetical protein|nr:hypothetical protein [Oscillospiraceae bacterium]